MTTHTDVLIIGSGPVGAAYAQQVLHAAPGASVTLVEAGPQLTDTPGANIRNLPLPQRIPLQERVTGPLPESMVPGGRPLKARPGTTLLRPDDGSGDGQQGMPAAALSTNVGGMGAHWTCAVPRPGGSERITFIADDELDAALTVAEGLLAATTTAFRQTAAGQTVLDALTRHFDPVLPDGRKTGPMPLACRPSDAGLPTWSGADTVLGAAAPQVRLRADTLARRLLLNGDTVTGAELLDLTTGDTTTVTADVVVVAADALRTPQLLWASGIRPPALGRYLNDQPQIVAGVRIDVPVEDSAARQVDFRDTLTGVCWVPFADDAHPFHGQVMQLDASPIKVEDSRDDQRPFVALGWFAAKELRAQDRVWFDDADLDEHGMPRIHIDYELSEADQRTVERARKEQVAFAAELGELTADPMLLPAGSSLHYQGTTRMGAVDDGTSVCDRDSRVWGWRNLFVGGNGVIPTATACNPTLTSVALAVLAADRIVDLLSASADADGPRR